MVDFTVDQFGTLTVLYDNVGLTNLQKDLDEWDRLMDVNAKSVLIGSRYAIPHMQKASGGPIINPTSMEVFTNEAVRSAYGASKAAVVNVTMHIATYVWER